MASLEARIAKHFARLHKAKICQTVEQQRRAYYTAPGPSLLSLHTWTQEVSRDYQPPKQNQTQGNLNGKIACTKPATGMEDDLQQSEGGVVDNPSPPPSPVVVLERLKTFDRYHRANEADSGEYESDLLLPYATQGPIALDDYPLCNLPESSDAPESEAAWNQDLIDLDSPTQLPSFNLIEPLNASQQHKSVDDLLATFPDSDPSEPTSLIIEPHLGGLDGSTMIVDYLSKSPGEGRLAFNHSSEMQERDIHHDPHSCLPTPFTQHAPVVMVMPSLAEDSSQNLDVNNKQVDKQVALPTTPQSGDRKEPFSFFSGLESLSASASIIHDSLNVIGQPNSSSSQSPLDPDINVGTRSQEEVNRTFLEAPDLCWTEESNVRNSFPEDEEIHCGSSEQYIRRNVCRKLGMTTSIGSHGKRRFIGRWTERSVKKRLRGAC